jgi:hypothetical protein
MFNRTWQYKTMAEDHFLKRVSTCFPSFWHVMQADRSSRSVGIKRFFPLEHMLDSNTLSNCRDLACRSCSPSEQVGIDHPVRIKGGNFGGRYTSHFSKKASTVDGLLEDMLMY